MTPVLAPALPFAPVLGGAVAGYLEAGDRETGRNGGVRVGVLVGVVPFLALLVFAVLLGSFLFVVIASLVGAPPGFIWGLGVAVFLLGALFAGVYVVGLTTVGGWLGVRIHDEGLF